MQINVIYSPACRQVHELGLDLPPGATVLHALQASGLQLLYPELQWQTETVGVWGRKASLAHVLREFDRVEIYRQLRVDPKVARRERFVSQGARTAGLFAKKRAGAKTGY